MEIGDKIQEGVEAYKKGNKTKAAELYKKASDDGDARGCNNLALMYAYGMGVKQDKFKAVEFY
ncbi:MAG TPA: sel1 repeat family protein [Epsilonproteobacteria bacterium]|nr:sel1 repeat family protein [Campylobacterota bacterium]